MGNISVTSSTQYLPLKAFQHVLVIVILTVFFMTKGQAEQLLFSKKPIEQGYSFHYQWLDHANKEQEISFILTQEGLFERFRSFKTYKNGYAQKAILRRIKKHMHKNPIAGVQIFYQQQHDKFSIQAKGLDQSKVNKAYREIVKLEEQVTNEYLKETYYQTFTNHEQRSGIKVDHVSIANNSVLDLKPLKPTILDKVSIQNTRKATNYVLSFVQNIPYSTLESRLTSSGAGFNPPLRVLWENQGDCDSKMTLTAALLRALMPRIEMALIYIDNHAFIGINIPPKAGELTIEHEQVTYLLAEPTGPALLPLGRLAPKSELAINQGHYTVESYLEVLPIQKLPEIPQPEQNQ